MLGLKKRQLRATGRRVKADVIEARSTLVSWGRSGDTHNRILWKVALRVQADDGAPFDVRKSMLFFAFNPPVAGGTVDVIYDPADHTKLMLDPEAQERRLSELTGGAQATGTAGVQGAPGAGVRVIVQGMDGSFHDATATPDPIDQLERLSALHASGALSDAEFAEQKQRLLGSDG